MPRFRCPYCKKEIGIEPKGVCPACGKGILIPDHLAKHSRSERKRAKEKIARDAERARVQTPLPRFSPGSNPGILLTVMAVLFFAGGLLVMRIQTQPTPVRSRAPHMKAARELDVLATALQHFYRDCGRYPSDEEGLRVLLFAPGDAGWQGPYVTLLRSDPWQTAYRYRRSGASFDLRSAGPDGLFGTEDDILPVLAESAVEE